MLVFPLVPTLAPALVPLVVFPTTPPGTDGVPPTDDEAPIVPVPPLVTVIPAVPFAAPFTSVADVPCGKPFTVGTTIVPVTPVVEFTFDGAIVGDVGNAADPGGIVGERFGGTPGPEPVLFVAPVFPFPGIFAGTPGPLGVVPELFALLGLFVPVLFAGLFVPVLFAVPFVPVLPGTPVIPPLFARLLIFDGVPALFAAPS